MFSQTLFNLISRLIFSRWARNYAEYNGPQEDACTAQLGPLHLELNHCFVLEHDDARIGVPIPTPWGRLDVSYTVCLGAEQIRRPGVAIRRCPRCAV